MTSFDYSKPSTIEEAAGLLASDGEAVVMAGGMTLLPAIKHRLAQPSRLVDITAIPGLHGIEIEDMAVVIGAATRHADVAASPELQAALPALAALAASIGDPQVRHCGTIGGSIANADPAADLPAALLALDGTVKTDRRSIAADEFFTAMFETALGQGELIASLRFARPRRAAYAKFANPASGYAIVGVFVAEFAGAVRVAVTGAAPVVFRWQEAETALARKFALDAVAGMTVDAAELNSDIHADAGYRAHLVGVMLQRAVRAALGGGAA